MNRVANAHPKTRDVVELKPGRLKEPLIGRGRAFDERKVRVASKHLVGNLTLYGAYRAIKCEFPNEETAVEVVYGYLAREGKHGDRDGEVEARSRLSHVARSEVDRYALFRDLESNTSQRAPHTASRLEHR